MRPWRGTLAAAFAAASILLAACGEGREPRAAGGACATSLVFRDIQYAGDDGVRVGAGRRLGRGSLRCDAAASDARPRRVAVRALRSIPPDVAVGVAERPASVYLAPGRPVALAVHPLHRRYYRSDRSPPRPARHDCPGRVTLKGAVATPPTVSEELTVRARDGEIPVELHARTRVRGDERRVPLLAAGTRVVVQAARCPDGERRIALTIDIKNE